MSSWTRGELSYRTAGVVRGGPGSAPVRRGQSCETFRVLRLLAGRGFPRRGLFRCGFFGCGFFGCSDRIDLRALANLVARIDRQPLSLDQAGDHFEAVAVVAAQLYAGSEEHTSE